MNRPESTHFPYKSDTLLDRSLRPHFSDPDLLLHVLYITSSPVSNISFRTSIIYQFPIQSDLILYDSPRDHVPRRLDPFIIHLSHTHLLYRSDLFQSRPQRYHVPCRSDRHFDWSPHLHLLYCRTGPFIYCPPVPMSYISQILSLVPSM